MIKDLSVLMAGSLAAGEEWIVDSRELPDGILVSLLPNPTSNPIIIPNLDDELCYEIGVTKKCTSGYLGEREVIQVGDCEEEPEAFPHNVDFTDVIEDICGVVLGAIVYSPSAVLAPGSFIYTDATMTVPFSDGDYIVVPGFPTIYLVNVDGELVDTFTTC